MNPDNPCAFLKWQLPLKRHLSVAREWIVSGHPRGCPTATSAIASHRDIRDCIPPRHPRGCLVPAVSSRLGSVSARLGSVSSRGRENAVSSRLGGHANDVSSRRSPLVSVSARLGGLLSSRLGLVSSRGRENAVSAPRECCFGAARMLFRRRENAVSSRLGLVSSRGRENAVSGPRECCLVSSRSRLGLGSSRGRENAVSGPRECCFGCPSAAISSHRDIREAVPPRRTAAASHRDIRDLCIPFHRHINLQSSPSASKVGISLALAVGYECFLRRKCFPRVFPSSTACVQHFSASFAAPSRPATSPAACIFSSKILLYLLRTPCGFAAPSEYSSKRAHTLFAAPLHHIQFCMGVAVCLISITVRVPARRPCYVLHFRMATRPP